MSRTDPLSYVFADIYPLYVQKAQKKNRSANEVDEIIEWFTGYSKTEMAHKLTERVTLRDFYAQAKINPKAALITGVICGIRVELIEDELIKNMRQLDKLIDELAKGRPMEKILRV